MTGKLPSPTGKGFRQSSVLALTRSPRRGEGPRNSHHVCALTEAQQKDYTCSGWTRAVGAAQSKKGLRDRISPTCTLSQNGYGDSKKGLMMRWAVLAHLWQCRVLVWLS